MLGFELVAFPVAAGKALLGLIALLATLWSGYRLVRSSCTFEDGAVTGIHFPSRLWLGTFIGCLGALSLYLGDSRITPSMKLDTGGVIEERTPHDVPEIVDQHPAVIPGTQQRAFDDAIRQRERELHDWDRHHYPPQDIHP